MGSFLYYIIDAILGLLAIAIIASVILSWLIAFNVINTRHPIVGQIGHFLDAVTRPMLGPLQKVIPPLGAVDLTPLIALIIIQGIRSYLLPWVFHPIIAALGG
jgi:YggT family protein